MTPQDVFVRLSKCTTKEKFLLIGLGAVLLTGDTKRVAELITELPDSEFQQTLMSALDHAHSLSGQVLNKLKTNGDL